MKTEVYSWRLSSELKSDLERAARHRRVALSSILEEAARKWLAESAANVSDDETQKKLHAAVEPFIGTLSGLYTADAQSIRKVIRRRLARRYGR
jgi:predicted transcriptional regulator